MGDERERLLGKIEAGEALSEVEQVALERLAAASVGPTLRLALAHARMNAEDDRHALTLLSTLVRDFPREPQVHLARARALVGLERYPEADRALEEALALNPGDPEAIKVQAAIALRRGEATRAKRLIDAVLERDPFDGDARLLLAELESSDFPNPPDVASRDQLAAALTERLSQSGLRAVRRERQLLIALHPDEVARLDLDTLWAGYAQSRQPLPAAVDETARELESLRGALVADPDALLARVRPVLRPPGFEAVAGHSAHREGPAGLGVFFVIHDPALLRYVSTAMIEKARVTLDVLERAAWKNLDASPARVLPVPSEDPANVPTQWVIHGDDEYDAGRLLCPTQRARIEEAVGAGPFGISLGCRGYVSICRVADAAALERLGAMPVSPDGIPGLFQLDGERLTRIR